MSIEEVRSIKVRANLDPAFRAQLMKGPLQFLQPYNLNEEEITQIILPHFRWLIENKLAATSYPEPDDAFMLLYNMGIRAILNLSEAPLPYETLRNVGLRSIHIPVEGFTVPTLEQVKQSLNMISWHLQNNLPVVIHCVAGLGRTGTILACYLVSQGIPASNAIARIRAWRPGSIEVPEQEAIVYEYEHFMRVPLL